MINACAYLKRIEMPVTITHRLTAVFSIATLVLALSAALPECALAYSGAAPSSEAATQPAESPASKMAGSVEMSPNKNIIENVSLSPDHTKLVAAIKAAGLDGTLSGAGPYIVFAPTNAAFDKLPAGTLDELMKPENKNKLAKILKYHVVPGRITSHDLIQLGQTGNKIPLRTIQGALFNISKDSTDTFWVEDENGGKAKLTQTDVKQSNGMIFVIDGVLMPK
jgi:uncharacterized surface protein with fasciclin (FAS1) repeats